MESPIETPFISPSLPIKEDAIRIASVSSFHSAIEAPASISHYDNLDLTPPAEDDSDETETWNTLDNMTELGLAFGPCEEPSAPPSPVKERLDMNDHVPSIEQEPARPHLQTRAPFEQWVRALNKKAILRRRTVSNSTGILGLDPELYSLSDDPSRSGHRKSLSGSSFAFVTAMKSASVSLASMSIAPRSRKLGRSAKYSKTDRSSRASNAGGRNSEDSTYAARGVVNDTAVTNRAIRRRHVLEEIISTEEGYCGDIKFLMTVYINLLASIPTVSHALRASIQRNLNEIAELHDEILGDLHRVVPHSEYSQQDYIKPTPLLEKKGHQRWRSLDAVPEHGGDLSWLQKIPGMTAEASVGADVANVFGKRMHRFFAYEEYGAKYEMMVKDVASARETLPQWNEYQKGLEALAASISSTNVNTGQPQKALTVGDLLVKPIQRVCRYPLLFAELLKQTPVCDCPESHLGIDKVLNRLRETTKQINRATDDPRMKATLEKTWMLQDRLQCPDQIDPRSRALIRTLGHIELCGVLHVAWRTRVAVEGEYMISLLYRDCLVLATVGKNEIVYNVRAMISFADMRIENADNGRGLQCHTAPHSFKIVFECDHQLFELIINACSPKEELEWRCRLADRAGREHISGYEQAFFTSAWFGIKSMGTVFGKPGTVARRLSIHRATTVGPKSPLCQVIIKNTSALKDAATATTNANINRSQSLLTTNRIPILAPSRGDRIRLERLLADVWTRHILPYPAMTGRSRGEHMVRASATSMMRKLSVASITSSFSNKMSGSIASLTSYNRPSEDHREATRISSVGNTTVDTSDERSKHSEDKVDHLPSFDVEADFDTLFDDKMMSSTVTSQPHPPTPILDISIKHMKRVATLRVKNALQLDGGNRKTPPLRTPSDSSLKATGLGARTASGNSLTLATPGSDRSTTSQTENLYPNGKQSKWGSLTKKSTGLHHLGSTERLGRFFA